jgi:hypothetical protein
MSKPQKRLLATIRIFHAVMAQLDLGADALRDERQDEDCFREALTSATPGPYVNNRVRRGDNEEDSSDDDDGYEFDEHMAAGDLADVDEDGTVDEKPGNSGEAQDKPSTIKPELEYRSLSRLNKGSHNNRSN